jgi:hypothetical protein
MLKFTFYFMERSHEQLHLVKWIFYIGRSSTYLQVLLG